ncbi:MAG: SLBB domain-containing protein [Chlorobiaceae bacterium]
MMMIACSGISPTPTRIPAAPEREYSIELPKKSQKFATKEQIEAITPQETYQYRLGPGDLVNIKVWRRPELSQESIVVSPDGFIAIPRVGHINVSNCTPEEVTKLVTEKLEVLYIKPEVTVGVKEFHNNKAFVLGRISKPGVINFPGNGTLLEGLALAGGLPDQGKMTRCSIIRGNNTVLWIDLQDLLKNGNMSLNAPIRNNDVIFVPELNDEVVYVMGEVNAPGAIQLKDGMNVLKAIMYAGGMNKLANPEKVFIIRQQDVKGDVISIDLNKLVGKGDFSQNFTLLPNDIVYISATGMAKFNYTLEKLTPSLSFLSLGTSIAESLGIMAKLRQNWWNQTGFVNSSSTTVTTGSSSGSTGTTSGTSSVSTSTTSGK